MSGVGGGLGVFLGGLLTLTLSWRWIFFINVPVGAVILAMAWVTVDRDVSRATARQLDIWGRGDAHAGHVVSGIRDR